MRRKEKKKENRTEEKRREEKRREGGERIKSRTREKNETLPLLSF